MRAITYLIEDEIKNNVKFETDLAVMLAKVIFFFLAFILLKFKPFFFKSINNIPHEVKQLSVQMISYLGTRSSKPLDASLSKVSYLCWLMVLKNVLHQCVIVAKLLLFIYYI